MVWCAGFIIFHELFVFQKTILTADFVR